MKAIRAGLTRATIFVVEIRALLRKAEPDGIFCYTFLKAAGLRCHGGDHRTDKGSGR